MLTYKWHKLPKKLIILHRYVYLSFKALKLFWIFSDFSLFFSLSFFNLHNLIKNYRLITRLGNENVSLVNKKFMYTYNTHKTKM